MSYLDLITVELSRRPIDQPGILLCGFEQLQLLPEEQYRFQPPEPFVKDSPGFNDEWIAACKGGKAATCNFDYAGPWAKAVLFGNVAFLAGGFDWDWQSVEIGSNAAPQAFIR